MRRFSVLNRFQGAIAGCLFSQTSQENSLCVYSQISDALITSSELAEKQWQQIRQYCGGKTASSTELALLLLPMFLFFHENLGLLKQQLEPARGFCPDVDDVFVWGSAMAWVIKDKLQPPMLLEQLRRDHSQVNSNILPQLKLVQMFLSENAGLKQVVDKLARHGSVEQTALALSLYCFFYTREDFSVSVNRAIKTGFSVPVVASLTAALAGGYNSYIGIPIFWRLTTEESIAYQNLYGRIERLFFAWCGVYQPNLLAVSSKEAIASFGIIQPRSSFELISQASD